eukprot:365263-Chlamydomonas_euryale.AAC.12
MKPLTVPQRLVAPIAESQVQRLAVDRPGVDPARFGGLEVLEVVPWKPSVDESDLTLALRALPKVSACSCHLLVRLLACLPAWSLHATAPDLLPLMDVPCPRRLLQLRRLGCIKIHTRTVPLITLEDAPVHDEPLSRDSAAVRVVQGLTGMSRARRTRSHPHDHIRLMQRDMGGLPRGRTRLGVRRDDAIGVEMDWCLSLPALEELVMALPIQNARGAGGWMNADMECHGPMKVHLQEQASVMWGFACFCATLSVECGSYPFTLHARPFARLHPRVALPLLT